MEEKKLIKKRQKALNENNEAALISACTDLANLYVEEGRYDFAIEEYTTVANIYKKENKMLEYATVCRGIGEAYLGLQNIEKALQYQKIYLKTAKELKNKLEEQRALATLGHTYLSSFLDGPGADKNNLDLANKYFKKSLVVSQSLNGQVSKIEIADMSARLFCNLGLVQDCMGNYESAKELILKSINLCKVHDLYEQLQRGYMDLAAVLVKIGDYSSALQQYNLAAEIAKKLRSKPTILAAVLLSKSDILAKLGDLHGAKSALLKAYKLNITDKKEHETIETNLRVVYSMCKNEEQLLITDANDYPQLKKLYEKMGDGACELKLFEKALDYYKKMLDAAEKANLSDLELATCYNSLAQTFENIGQYEQAVAHFEKELKHCNSLKYRLDTLSTIADTKESGDASVESISTVYERAIKLCQDARNKHEEGRMLKRFTLFLRRKGRHSEAFKLEERFNKLDFHSSDSESETSEAPAGSVIGGDIDLDAITDLSEDSDLERPSTKPRRRAKNFQVRRNAKGETQLHTACIKGQFDVVRTLLEQGHPVNVRDNCGWLPLHEACINGHKEVVELLLNKGAATNDRGGTKCEGVTPLHDAACNGHLEVVRVLLDRGANAMAKTDSGESVLEFLQRWRNTVQLEDHNSAIYESLIERIGKGLAKAGHVARTPTKSTRGALIDAEESQLPTRPESPQQKLPTPSKNLRRSNYVGLEDDHFSSPKSHAAEYKDVIENLRRRTDVKMAAKPVIKRPALLSTNDVFDDWLEDDVGKTVKKRKTNSPTKSQTSKKSKSPTKSQTSKKSASPTKSQSSRSVEDYFEIIIDDDPMNEIFTSNVISPSNSSTSSQKSNSRKKQTKLTNFGHTRVLIEPDSTSSPKTTKTKSPKTLQAPILEPTLSVDVRINSKLYRVPILLSQINSYTIKWLAEEAATRYARKEYMIPTLELETKNGAILADDDPISLLFPMGTTQAEEVEGRVVKWNVPSLIERYKEACQDMLIETDDNICRTLQELTVSLDLHDCALKGTMLAPLCKVLNRQINLLELDLSGNFLNDECFRYLGASLSSLENLYKINLNCTTLRPEHLATITNNLPPDVAYKVTDLNLSDNLIGDESFENLSTLTQRFQLKKLNLSGNKLKRCHFVDFNLSNVEEFDISDNFLNNEALLKILSCLKIENLKTVNVSRNSVTQGFLKDVLNMWNEAPRLTICEISRCYARDCDIFDLLRMAPFLETLDVSYNNDLTSVSLRKLLESNVQDLRLYECKNIFEYFTDFSKYLDGSCRQNKTIKISIPESCKEEKDCLIQMWNDVYGNASVVKLSTHFLCLSLTK